MEPGEYRKMAEVEDHMWYYRALHRHIGRSVSSFTGEKSRPVRLLDAGCGTGGLLRSLQRVHTSWNFSGIDFSALACELATERTGLKIVEGSVSSLPFAGNVFDAIVSCDVLCQVSDPRRAIQEFNRCLRPGGWVVVTMPAYSWLYSYHDREVSNLKRYTRGEVNRLLVGAGFRILRSTYWNTLPFPLVVAKRKVFSARSAATSDVKGFPAPVEAFFNGMMAIEHGWFSIGGSLPFGTSILTVAKKPSDHLGRPP